MSNRFYNDYYSHHSKPVSSYNSGILIQPNGSGPPPPMLTQVNPNTQNHHILHQKGQFSSEEKNTTTLNPYPEALSGQRPMLIADPLYDQHIIKPPKANVTQGRIPDIEFISSEDRNFRLYPTSSDYVVQLKDEYKNVTSVTLFNANIPNTAFLVGQRNNMLYIQESFGETIPIEIPVGDYTPTLLRTAIENALNTAGSSTYTVTLDTLTNKYTIASDLSGGGHIFNLQFFGGLEPFDKGGHRPKYIERSIGRVLGYPRQDFLYAQGTATVTAGSTTVIGDSQTMYLTNLTVGETIHILDINQVVTVASITSDSEFEISVPATGSAIGTLIAKGTHPAPNKYDLSSEAFIVLDIPELENVRANASFIDRSFAVIPMVSPHNTKNFILSSNVGIPPYKKYFNPPLSKLDRLTIRFRDIDGNLINFNGIQNFLEFRILTLNAPGFYDPGAIN